MNYNDMIAQCRKNLEKYAVQEFPDNEFEFDDDQCMVFEVLTVQQGWVEIDAYNCVKNYDFRLYNSYSDLGEQLWEYFCEECYKNPIFDDPMVRDCVDFYKLGKNYAETACDNCINYNDFIVEIL